MSGSASIKNGALWINGNEVRKLSELNPMHDNSSKGEGFKMPVGKQMFVTMRLCNEAMLCTNKSLGVVVITNSQSVVATSTNGTAIKEKLALSTRKRSAAELDITTPSGKENKEGTGKKSYHYISHLLLIWMRIIGYLMTREAVYIIQTDINMINVFKKNCLQFLLTFLNLYC